MDIPLISHRVKCLGKTAEHRGVELLKTLVNHAVDQKHTVNTPEAALKSIYASYQEAVDELKASKIQFEMDVNPEPTPPTRDIIAEENSRPYILQQAAAARTYGEKVEILKNLPKTLDEQKPSYVSIYSYPCVMR